MSDTFDREQRDAAQPDRDCARQEPAAGAEGAPGVEDFTETAVQFPKLEPSDYPVEEVEDIPMEDEELPMLEEDKPLSKGRLGDYVAKMDDKQFRRAQMIFGIVLGLIGAICLMIPIPNGDGSSSMWNFVIALVVVMWIPRFVERKIGQRIPSAQKWMLIVFAAGMLCSLGYNLLAGNFASTQSAAAPAASASAAPSAASSLAP